MVSASFRITVAMLLRGAVAAGRGSDQEPNFEALPDSVPPQNVEAEEAVLGGILLDPCHRPRGRCTATGSVLSERPPGISARP